MRGRRSRRMGGVRPRRRRCRRPGEIVARDASLGGAGRRRRRRRARSSRCSPAAASFFTALGDDDARARVGRARWPRSASTCTSQWFETPTRRAWTHVDARRRADDHGARRQALAARPAAARRLRRGLLRRRRRRGAARRRARRASSPRRRASCRRCARPACQLDLLVGSAQRSRASATTARSTRGIVVLTDGAHGGTRERRAASPPRRCRARSSTPTARATRSPRRSASRSRAATTSHAALALAARGRRGRDHGAGPVRGAASVAEVTARVSWISLTPVKALALAQRRRGRAARGRPARRPALLPRRRDRPARQQQGPRPAAARPRGVRRRRATC